MDERWGLFDLDLCTGLPFASSTCCPMLATHNLTIRFGGHAAVNGVTMCLCAGHAHRHRGPNGAGQDDVLQPHLGPAPKASAGSVQLGGQGQT